MIAVLHLALWNWKWIGVLGASESLFEGCVYINLVIYWNQKKGIIMNVVMSVKAIENIWDGATGGEAVPDYMNYLQLGNYTGLKDAYISYRGDEVFAAFADSVKARLKQYGVHVTMEIADGLYHSYAMMPLVKEAQSGYRNMIAYLSE